MNMKGMWVMQLYSHEMISKVVTERRKRILNLVEGQEVLSVKTNTVKETNDFQCLVR
jgi:hypothetical protein